ncbi:RagB/SusD family nutrient uptake outer membrane protein [Autumnicola musiva]|uniref:RagB/SusD family nutrient uptake outer membrane protein n=1 Tax=Autumnicola musiva TaxID=3075589 RepID=A0ABU3D098_9FLAO|nr:RagB/SusD family nutrient uptake outer membrane protein [Zunongwangia sp. F117]MDT0674965.1 RagB/SusD family nutrient uptake outer membrane protein [Zunongwangia sp. F117]
MKNYIKFLSLSFISLVLFSCDDEINDLEPFTEGNPETFFNSEASFQNGVDGVYSQLFNYYASTTEYNAEAGYQTIPDILADNVILATTGRRSNEVYYDWQYVPNTGGAISLYWSEAYEAVNAANLIIGQINNLPEGDVKDNILGQALAARAFAHFDLVRIYAKIPTQSEDANSSLGVVYVKVEDGDTGDPYAEPARETVESNYAEIISDLERAAELIGASNGEGRLDRDAVYAILSRVYLYNGDYQNVIDAANEVSEPIATAEELPGVYTDATNTGVIVEWSVNTSSESTFSNIGVAYSQTTGETVRSEYVADYEFINSVDTSDVRHDVLTYVGVNSGNQYNAVKKFLGEEGQNNGLVDVKVLRAAEVVLNKSEAQYRLGMETEALETLNELRDKRLDSYEGGEAGEELLNTILSQRRIELAFEGHRFFDIKRMGDAIVRSNNGDILDGSGTPPQELTLPAGNFRFQFPIPQAEINANSNIEQNPGY